MRQTPTQATGTGSSATAAQNQRQAAFFARLAIGGIILYLALDVITQLLPPHYNPISQAESDLAVGPYGFVMTINFVVRGLLSLALLASLAKGTVKDARSPLGMALLGIWSIAAVLLALFPTDLAGAHPTAHGAIHLLLAFIAFVCAPVGEVLLARGFARDVNLRSISAPAQGIAVAALVMMVVVLLGFGSRQVFGLFERGFLALVLAWMLLVAYRLRSARA